MVSAAAPEQHVASPAKSKRIVLTADLVAVHVDQEEGERNKRGGVVVFGLIIASTRSAQNQNQLQTVKVDLAPRHAQLGFLGSILCHECCAHALHLLDLGVFGLEFLDELANQINLCHHQHVQTCSAGKERKASVRHRMGSAQNAARRLYVTSRKDAKDFDD